ncbi:Gfo/Idh/MocA family protein [Propioniciclava coleopterorum]|uniref:Gfo/Idh/MocA family protein n=1 Tax=Propioniciclava coleopterorum TaxID=2714937 RepID=UPI001FE3C2E8|nr:Gfo/Idh/MocA family oxidoreductase [Propioniciclava coleopterorum]
MTSLPLTRVPDPADAPVLRWGILAPGGIASSFVRALAAHTTQRVVACGSRSTARAQEFAHEHGLERAHGSYEQLLADPGVDVVYVASPHSRHAEQALAAIEAGKHVLVEKSFTQDAGQAQAVVDAARAAGVTLMEAMWTRFLPHIDVLRQLLADGALGELVSVHADHGQFFPPDPRHRMFDPDAAGGALLDLGIYPVSFASFVLGTPTRVTARGTLTDTGVDRTVSMVLDGHPGTDAHALLGTTLAARTPTTAAVSGSAGRVEIGGPFYNPQSLTLVPLAGDRVSSPEPVITRSGGLAHQAAHFATLVEQGRQESPWLPWAESVAIMATLDEVRAQVGVVYPGE